MSRRRRYNDGPSVVETFEVMRSDYQAARSSRFKRVRTGLPAVGGGADYHYRSEADYLRMMEYARDMDRNDCMPGVLLDVAADNTVQEGMTLDVRTGDTALNTALYDRWWDWAEDPEQCDLAGEREWNALERHAYRQMMVDGDIVFIGTRSGQLEAVEAHRVRTPSTTKRPVVNGVLLDKDTRRRLEYWITRDDVDPAMAVRQVSEIAPRRVRNADGVRELFHVYSSKRVSQTRGVTAFAPIIEISGQFEDIQFAKLVQAQIVSCVTFLRQKQLGAMLGAPEQTGARETQTQSDGSSRIIDNLAPGMEITAREGETLEGFSPNVPNAEYFEHMTMTLRMMSVNFGVPLMVALLDASQTNFSGWRGALDQAKLGWRRNQTTLIARLHKPVYVWKLHQWMSEDPALRRAAERLGKRFFEHAWRRPAWPYIEPLKDAQADAEKIGRALSSHRRVLAERGIEWSEVAAEIVEDRVLAVELAINKADELNRKYPNVRIDWRELLPTDIGRAPVYALTGEAEAGAPAPATTRGAGS